MSKAGDEFQEPPPQLDEDGNPIVVEVGSKSGTSNTPTLEDLMKKFEKLKVENKKLKAEGKKGKTYSSSNQDGDSSFEDEVSKKGRKGRNKHDKHPITLCLLITIICIFIPPILSYPLAKLPISMGRTTINESIA
jgi:hypothetical protein